MATLEKTYTFNGHINEVFRGLTSYKLYSSYLPGVKKIEVLPAKSKSYSCQVRYELTLIKTFYYTLNMKESEPNDISWDLADSNLMTSNTGRWRLKANEVDPAKTDAIYTLEVKFKGLVPSMVTDQIAQANLPLMFTGFQKLIDETSERSKTKGQSKA